VLARKGSLRRAGARPCALRAVRLVLHLRRAAPAGFRCPPCLDNTRQPCRGTWHKNGRPTV